MENNGNEGNDFDYQSLQESKQRRSFGTWEAESRRKAYTEPEGSAVKKQE